MTAETMWLVVAGALGLAVILFVAYLVVSTARSRPDGGRHRSPNKKRPHRDTFRTEEPEPEPLKQAAVIVQAHSPALRAELTSQCVAAGWDEPLWHPASNLAEAAAGARAALEAGVEVVCILGDAAVTRGVVSVLAGSETPVAFLPTAAASEAEAASPSAESVSGKPVSDTASDTEPDTEPGAEAGLTTGFSTALAAALTIALTGQNSRVDIGRATLAPAPGMDGEAHHLERERGAGDTAGLETPGSTAQADAGEEVVFVHSIVFGDVVSHEAPALSTRIVARGLVKGTSFAATIKPDDEEAVTRPARSVALSTAETAATSGRLSAYLHASHTLKGWTGVARAMMRKSSRPTPLLVPLQSAVFTISLDRPTALTIDGLPSGSTHPGEATVSAAPLALVVRR